MAPELSLLELTRAYGVLADGGKLATTRTVLMERRNRTGLPVDSA